MDPGLSFTRRKSSGAVIPRSDALVGRCFGGKEGEDGVEGEHGAVSRISTKEWDACRKRKLKTEGSAVRYFQLEEMVGCCLLFKRSSYFRALPEAIQKHSQQRHPTRDNMVAGSKLASSSPTNITFMNFFKSPLKRKSAAMKLERIEHIAG
ncbi:hypothetical protein BJ508DRAFT_307323 [Ascobolus immersus RN42]|uniref:Uncharacterized protein n=1 Tax=Ascobolus immersus RN42 TaxID=1160509 RepID=A0A3N4I311_ASCIM|nr:hypothetical protein BJ508DRAFT_307323 [Ascobolus immersus RN42]